MEVGDSKSASEPVSTRAIIATGAVMVASLGPWLHLVTVRRYRFEDHPWWSDTLVVGLTLVGMVSALLFWLGVTQRLSPILRTSLAYVLAAILFGTGMTLDVGPLILVGVMGAIAAFVLTLAEWEGIEAQLERFRHARATGAALIVLGVIGVTYLGMNLAGFLSLHADQREGFMGAVLAFPILMVLTGVKLLRGRRA